MSSLKSNLRVWSHFAIMFYVTLVILAEVYQHIVCQHLWEQHRLNESCDLGQHQETNVT